jgi:hypothetical protein
LSTRKRSIADHSDFAENVLNIQSGPLTDAFRDDMQSGFRSGPITAESDDEFKSGGDEEFSEYENDKFRFADENVEDSEENHDDNFDDDFDFPLGMLDDRFLQNKDVPSSLRPPLPKRQRIQSNNRRPLRDRFQVAMSSPKSGEGLF